MTHRVDDALVEKAWDELRRRCCSDPPHAKRCVMVDHDQFRAALEVAGVAELREENERLRAHISEHVAFVEKRIQDGIELGAAVWRIALEDIARENRAALNPRQNDGDGE